MVCSWLISVLDRPQEMTKTRDACTGLDNDESKAGQMDGSFFFYVFFDVNVCPCSCEKGIELQSYIAHSDLYVNLLHQHSE